MQSHAAVTVDLHADPTDGLCCPDHRSTT